MKRMGTHGSRSLSEVLREMEEKFKLNDPLTDAAIKEHWARIMGPLISNHTTSLKFKDGLLRIGIDNAPLKAELSMRKEEIIHLINTEMGADTIREVHIR
jgi:predicted nucleic acid-binding Zn ribbon protein